MKRTIAILTVLFLLQPCLAQSKKFSKKMKKNVALLDSAKKEEDYLNCARLFMKMKERNQWTVNYYIALGYLLACFEDKQENAEQLCDTAEVFLNKADSLSNDNSEIFVLRAMLASGRVMAAPMARWAKYGKISYDALEKAISLDQDNPRPYVLKAITARYSPGGGCEKALSNAQKAEERFTKSNLQELWMPHWGKEQILIVKTECKEN